MKGFSNKFKIGDLEISIDKSPLIVAEISGNHSKDINKAYKMLRILKDIGVSAVKIQSYRPYDITLPGIFKINDKKSIWAKRDLYSLFEEGTLSYENQKKLIEFSRKIGLELFSSPFSISNVDFLLDNNINAFKIASFESNHYPMLKKIAQSKKPVILSTGVSNYKQIKNTLKFLYDNGTRKCVVLKTTSSYPADPKNSNINTITYLKNNLNIPVGISDHTKGIGSSIASISLGACIIEKHFTLDKNDGALDSSFSLEPDEFKSLVEESKIAFESLGKVNFEVPKKNLLFKRSIYTAKDLKKGQEITKDNIQVIRPFLGIDSAKYYKIIGKKVKLDLDANQPLKEEYLL